MPRVVRKSDGLEAFASHLNPHGVGEMIVYFEDGDASSEYVRDWDLQEPDEHGRSLYSVLNEMEP